MYFSAPDAASLTGEFTIGVTAQLGDGAVAGHWLVDMYNRVTGTWDTKGDLIGGTYCKLTSSSPLVFSSCVLILTFS